MKKVILMTLPVIFLAAYCFDQGDPPAANFFAGASNAAASARAALAGPEVLDLSRTGIRASGGIAGNAAAVDADEDEVPDAGVTSRKRLIPGKKMRMEKVSEM